MTLRNARCNDKDAVCLFICSLFNECISDLDRVVSSDADDASFRHLNFGVVVGLEWSDNP